VIRRSSLLRRLVHRGVDEAVRVVDGWTTPFTLSRVDERPVPDAPSEIRMFSVVRDEALRLPYLLRYYRGLGVSRMFFVDHESTDGTTDLLLDEGDVHLWRARGNFRRKTAWLHHVLRRHGVGNWCAVADADELLTYPGAEQLPLPALCKYLDAVGATALQCTLVDLFPRGPLHACSYTAGMPFTDVADHFDPALRVRERVFQRAPCLEKFPLLRFHPGMRLRPGRHAVSNARPAKTRGAMLHFKFLPDFLGSRTQRLAESAARNRLLDPAYAAETRRYAEVVESGAEFDLARGGAVTYTGTAQLEELGLVRRGPGYPVS